MGVPYLTVSIGCARNNDLPAHVKGYVCKQLKVPTTHSENLLPLPWMSVLDLVHMNLPPISSGQDAYSNIPCTFSFFSPTHPINDVEILKQVIVPPKGLVAKLLDQAKQCWLDGAESLTLPGVSHNLPLWSLHFWSDLHLIVNPAQVSWKQALNLAPEGQSQPIPGPSSCDLGGPGHCVLVGQPSSTIHRSNPVHKGNSSQFSLPRMAI